MTAVLCRWVFLEWLFRVRLEDCRYSYSSHLFDAKFLHTLQIALESDWKQSFSSLACHVEEIPLAQSESNRKQYQGTAACRSW